MRYVDRPLGLMLDPDATKVLPRRILASLIDLGIVVILGILALKTTALKYAITERDVDGEWQQTASQFQQLKDLSFARFVRIQEIGDTMYVFGGRNFWLGLLFALLLPLLVFLLIPAAVGASPGKKLASLTVVDYEGEPASLGQHFMRTVVGIVDFPVGGLLGWIVASQDLHTRRFGDRVAKTYVVDAKKPVRMVDADAWHRRKAALNNPLLVDNPTDLDSMVALNDRLGIPGEPLADDLDLDVDADSDIEDVDELSFEPAAVDELDFSLADGTDADIDEPETEALETDEPETTAPVAEAADTANPEPLPTLDQTEPEWEIPVGTPSPTWSPDELDAGGPAKVASATAVASVTDPIWNAEWNAWLYWDADRERWLRHDQVDNQWVPIS